jgi:hypothetical protein
LNLADYFLFDRLDEGLGARPAVRYGARVYSYSDVAGRARSLAGYWAGLGIAGEARVSSCPIRRPSPGRFLEHSRPAEL